MHHLYNQVQERLRVCRIPPTSQRCIPTSRITHPRPSCPPPHISLEPDVETHKSTTPMRPTSLPTRAPHPLSLNALSSPRTSRGGVAPLARRRNAHPLATAAARTRPPLAASPRPPHPLGVRDGQRHTTRVAKANNLRRQPSPLSTAAAPRLPTLPPRAVLPPPAPRAAVERREEFVIVKAETAREAEAAAEAAASARRALRPLALEIIRPAAAGVGECLVRFLHFEEGRLGRAPLRLSYRVHAW